MKKKQLLLTTYFPLAIVFFASGSFFGQVSNYKRIDSLLLIGKNYSALKLLNEYKSSATTPYALGTVYYYMARAYGNENTNGSCFSNYILAKEQFAKADSIEKAMEINLDIAYLFSTQKFNQAEAKKYITNYLVFARKTGKYNLLAKGYSKWAAIAIEDNPRESLHNFGIAEKYNAYANDDNTLASIYNNTAVIYNEKIIKPDSALFFLKKAMILAQKVKDPNDICLNLINQAGAYYRATNYKQAIDLLHAADKLPITKFVENTKGIIQDLLSVNYESLGDYKNAFDCLNNYNDLQNRITDEKQNTIISELQTKYKTKEKELENANLKNIIYSIIGLLVVLVVIAFLLYKNLVRKKKIAEQEKLLQTQKLETTLKEQELHDIDVMLESQEKERQRIANELHDNLGSMLATLKLNFQNIKRQDKVTDAEDDLLYTKTDTLIDEAYQEIRNISHLKNLGVIGNEGLLVAVKKMAEKMSVLKKLQINVIPFGLNNRLENTLEVNLFRIIQELCTNIIKHSGATEVNIYITQHGSATLNLIIEDNGKGFDPKIILTKEGIGLKNIEKKITLMGGTFTIDSILSKGSTLIIDIPL